MGKQCGLSVDPHSSVEPPRWLWLWLPLILFTVLLLLALRDDSNPGYSRPWADYMVPHSEHDVIEQGTAVAAALAVVAGIAALRHRRRLPSRWLRGWVALITLGCFSFFGEEVTWGQYCLGWCWSGGSDPLWNAPEWWPTQHTNLHSLASLSDDSEFAVLATWFYIKPRLLFELFVLYGGIIHVLLQRGRHASIGASSQNVEGWFWPNYICLPTALLAILARVPDRLDWLGFGYAPLMFDPGLLNWKSLQELFFALFLFLYLLSIWYRLARHPEAIKPLPRLSP
jgi:hypothetical protein